jgi:hemoglobin
MKSLYDRLGGRQALHTLIDLFYYKVLLDPILKPKFTEADMISLKEHQLEFMTFVFGGSSKHYPMERLYAAHSKLNITEEQFAAVARHLKASMDELQVPNALQAEVMDIVGETHDVVVTA